jgi:ATP-dependent DNA helicase RecG
VQRDQRPCHRAHDGPHASSYIRVGDADQRLTPAEVDQMLANRSTQDHSRGRAPDGAAFDPTAIASFVTALHATNSRNRQLADDELLRRQGAADDDGRPTLAGFLTLGDVPQLLTAAARVTYRRNPRTPIRRAPASPAST